MFSLVALRMRIRPEPSAQVERCCLRTRATDLLAPKTGSTWKHYIPPKWMAFKMATVPTQPTSLRPACQSTFKWITEMHNRMIDTWEAKSLSTTSNKIETTAGSSIFFAGGEQLWFWTCFAFGWPVNPVQTSTNHNYIYNMRMTHISKCRRMLQVQL